MKFQTPKGTRDYWGDSFYIRQNLANKILSVTQTYGFKQALTPMFESLELLTKDAGAVEEQIYRITDKAGREFGLKSDITPPITRIVANEGRSYPKPIKISCFDRVYRYERPQKGRYREISQINAEMFGVRSARSDAEIIRCFYDCYQKIGLPNVQITIGYRPLLESFVSSLTSVENILPIIRLIDKKDKIGIDEFNRQLVVFKISKTSISKINKFVSLRGSVKEVIAQTKKLFSDSLGNKKFLNNISRIFKELSDYGVSSNCKLDLGLARGSDYYTGIIFEVRYPGLESFGSIGGGGRYDNLVEFYGGPKTPAVGFSIGINRVMDLLASLDIKDSNLPNLDYFIANESSPCKLATIIRNKGFSVEIDLNNSSLSDQVALGKKRGARFIIIVKRKIRLLEVSTGQEKPITINDIV